MGFKDGITNPNTTDATDMNQKVWIQPGAPEPAWTAGGTYQVVRIIRMLLDQWASPSCQRQPKTGSGPLSVIEAGRSCGEEDSLA
jgi:deferrochelatase/peroxidase EfeB